MNKILATLMISAGFMLAATQANAATVAGNFNVTVTLDSRCTMAAIGDLAFGTYTAFRATDLAATDTTATLTCTRGLTGVTAAFDTVAAGATAAAAATDAVGAGVIAGLQYDITATAQAVLPGTAATAGNIGTADTREYIISGNMPADQAGTCATNQTACNVVASQQRTLTVTY